MGIHGISWHFQLFPFHVGVLLRRHVHVHPLKTGVKRGLKLQDPTETRCRGPTFEAPHH